MLGNTAFAATPFADISQGTFLSSAVAEAANTAASQGTQMSFVGAMLEQFAADGTPSKTLTIPVAISETVTGLDEPAALIVMGMQINEANVFSDTVRSRADYVAAQNETASVRDAVAGVFNAYMSISDSIAVLDANTRRLLWENIPDNQAVAWTNINTPTSNWNVLDDGQDPSWENIE